MTVLTAFCVPYSRKRPHAPRGRGHAVGGGQLEGPVLTALTVLTAFSSPCGCVTRNGSPILSRRPRKAREPHGQFTDRLRESLQKQALSCAHRFGQPTRITRGPQPDRCGLRGDAVAPPLGLLRGGAHKQGEDLVGDRRDQRAGSAVPWWPCLCKTIEIRLRARPFAAPVQPQPAPGLGTENHCDRCHQWG
jgi:hypothetical protein